MDDITKIKDSIQESIKNVAIFIDYDNMYHSMRELGIDITSKEYNIIDLLWELYGRDNVRTIRAYADFDQIEVKMRDLQIKRVQVRQVYGNGREERYRKNASDIELSIDVVESFYKDSNIDTYVFMTADSDMIPIMSRMIFKGKTVHLFYSSLNISQYQNITDYTHLYVDLLELLKIDKERANPSYWEDKAIKVIENWYNDNKENNKLLGATWLNSELSRNLTVSSKKASSIIEHLEKNKTIINYSNGFANGFVLYSDIELMATKFPKKVKKETVSV